MKVLIVDDHDDYRAYLTGLLQRAQPIELTEAYDLTSMRKLLDSGEFQLCYLNVDLPDGNGIQFLKTYRSTYPETRFILLSLFPEPTCIKEAKESGALGFFPKSVCTSALLNSCLSSHKGTFLT